MKSLEEILWGNGSPLEEGSEEPDIIMVNCLEICCATVCWVQPCGCALVASCIP